jgi:hypothetical protein
MVSLCGTGTGLVTTTREFALVMAYDGPREAVGDGTCRRQLIPNNAAAEGKTTLLTSQATTPVFLSLCRLYSVLLKKKLQDVLVTGLK